MFEIVFDSSIVETECVFTHNNLTVNLFQSDNESYQFNKSRNLINIKFDKVEKNFGIGRELMDVEMEFLKNLTSKKDKCPENKECWIRSYEGILSDFDLKTLENYNSNKKKIRNQLNLTFNDSLKIDYNDKTINITEFKNLCKNKIMTVNLKLMFYAIISITKDKYNINVRLKVKEMKVIDMKNHVLQTFQINELEIVKANKQIEFIKKYPTGQKKAVNNILHLFNNDS